MEWHKKLTAENARRQNVTTIMSTWATAIYTSSTAGHFCIYVK